MKSKIRLILSIRLFIFIVNSLNSVSSFPHDTPLVSTSTEAMVIITSTVAPDASKTSDADVRQFDSKQKLESSRPEISSVHIKSDIKYRYSRTHVTSKVANLNSHKSQETTFRVVLPEAAFISKFVMEIDGTAYEALLKEKEEAKQVYVEAQNNGQSAGLVEVSTRNTNIFNVNVNIKPESKVTFNLTYEELLSRKLGRYEHTINIIPEQLTSVKDFQIAVNIEEAQNITYLRLSNLGNDLLEEQETSGGNAEIVRPSGNMVNINWSPNVTADNEAMLAHLGQFIVQYDINRESNSGEILLMEGYFVHFFAPDDLPPLRKHVVFVLDISGSMNGRKMVQMKESQKKILDDLSSEDFFNIITFSDKIQSWTLPKKAIPRNASPTTFDIFIPDTFEEALDPSSSTDDNIPYPATKENILQAQVFIDSLSPGGGTNIHDSLITAIDLTKSVKANKASPENTSNNLTTSPAEIRNKLPANVESLILFLTDGEPTVGITEPTQIQKLIETANSEFKIPIYSLGFGAGVDFPFLKKLSLQNFGFSRKIYEASDAAIQLKGFYNEIASPLLSNVAFNYTSTESNIITEVTDVNFPTIFRGNEVVIAGKIDVDSPAIDYQPDDDLCIRYQRKLSVAITGIGSRGGIDIRIRPPYFCVPHRRRPIRPTPTPQPPPSSEEDQFLEHLWAYLTIKQLINRDFKDESKLTPTSDQDLTSTVKKETPKEYATRLAMKYKFVTPFTSLVVVKPNRTEITEPVPYRPPPPIRESALANPFGGLPQSGIGFPSESQFSFQAAIPSVFIDSGSHTRVGSQPGSSSNNYHNRVHLQQAMRPSVTTPRTTTVAPSPPPPVSPKSPPTISDISWLNPESPFILFNGTKYQVALNKTQSPADGYEFNPCEISTASGFRAGECRHLMSCVQSEFTEKSEDTFIKSFFCPIKTESPVEEYFVGVCCPKPLKQG